MHWASAVLGRPDSCTVAQARNEGFHGCTGQLGRDGEAVASRDRQSHTINPATRHEIAMLRIARDDKARNHFRALMLDLDSEQFHDPSRSPALGAPTLWAGVTYSGAGRSYDALAHSHRS